MLTMRMFPFALAALLALPTLAAAQIEKGDSQISLQGSLSTDMGSSSGTSTTSGFIGGQYGYYLTRQIAVRGVLMMDVTYSSSSSGEFDEYGGGSTSSTSTSTGIGGGVELNLTGAGQKFVPYVAFDMLTFSSGSGSQSITLMSPSVGARAFVSRNTAFNVAVAYQTSSANPDYRTIETSFGFSFFFGSDKRR